MANFPAVFRTQTLVEIWITELEQRRQQPGEDVNTYAAALQKLYRRVKTNAFAYPEVIKARKFVNGLLPDPYVTVKPHNDQTWNSAVNRAKAYELTHRDQGAISAYLNKFTPMTTTDHTGDLLKAIQDLSKQVQSIGNGYRGYRNNNSFRNANQQQMVQTTQGRPNQVICYSCGELGHISRTCPNRNNVAGHITIAGPIGAARKYRRPAFKLGGVPQEGKRIRQTTIPSNLTLLETYPATRTTQSKSRFDLTTGTIKDIPLEEETIVQTIQNSGKAKQPIRSTEAKKVELKKAVKKKPAVVAPIYKMVEPYTPQQFFDQKADITNGQLLAMNPKFSLTVAKQLRNPVVRTKTEEQDKKLVKKDDEIPNNGNVSEVEDLMQVANTAEPNDDRTLALYCEASIKHIKFLLIVDSGSAGSIISLSLLKDLDMEIMKASKTIMVNVNRERRRPLGAVTDIPLKIHECIIPMNAIVTDANSYSAIVRNDWLRKTKVVLDYNNNRMTIKWKDQVLEVTTKCREMPHHVTSIEIPNMEVEEEAEDESEKEVDEEAIEESKEEYESDDKETQEQLFCNASYITQEKAQEIEEELKEGNFVSNKYYYQYEEIEKGKFHTRKLDEKQHCKFDDFMERYQDLFAWDPNDFRRTSVVTHKIDTREAIPINNSIEKSMDFASRSGGKEKWQETSLCKLSEVKSHDETRPISLAKNK
ncbi:hypothetical protein RhiirA5_436915 [Rhizophagus irregularis]|uniref:CCHC-type domain-containing protein n=1 Tax=Rhizophagus irregularis TaxID=588596 RepID=A0A2N0NL66_9GLOM|nr:hypothetical protein RhiirA5_436915 [Rhizophagus irregularis]